MQRWVINAAIVTLLFSNAVAQRRIVDFRKFDEFGDVNCEDEAARLDNFAFYLKQQPAANAVILFYGGKTFRGRTPKRGEAEARAARLKPYLVERRGIPSSHVIVVNGGYSEEWHVDLWIVPTGSVLPSPERTPIPDKQIHFRKGKPNPRDFRCRV